MAATGKTPILLYGSTTPTNQPSAGNLTNSSDGCEIAINVADKNLFFKDSTNAVNTVPIRQSSGSSNGWLSSTDWTTFNNKQAALVSGTNIKTVSGTSLLGSGDVGTIGTGYGGTGLTSFTAKGVVYASSTSALATGSTLQFDGTNLGIGVAPKSWSVGKVLSIYNGGSIFGGSGTTDVRIIANAYFNGGWKYQGTGTSTRYDQDSGSHAWFTAASGSADAAISYTQAMTLFNSGGVSIGNTTDPGAGNLSVNGNVVITTSGKGIDFSATAGTGTSELLADYEEGTWTPTDASGAGLTFSGVDATYTKIGRLVTCNFKLTYPVTASSAGAIIAGLPYTSGSYGAGTIQGYFSVRTFTISSNGLYGGASSAQVVIDKNNGTSIATNADLSNSTMYATLIYQV